MGNHTNTGGGDTPFDPTAGILTGITSAAAVAAGINQADNFIKGDVKK